MEDLTGFQPLFLVAQGVGVLAIILMAVYTTQHNGGFAWRSDPDKEFNWHPLLMTIGFIYLYGNSIMIYRGMRNLRKYRLKLIHAGIHLTALVLVIIALVAVFDSHNLAFPPRPNLYSLHSWIGLGTVIIFSLQWVLSLLTFLYPGASNQIRAAFMPYHVYIGLAAFVLALASAMTGLTERLVWTKNFSSLPPAVAILNVIGLCFVIFGGLVVYIVTEAKYKRYPRPEDGALLNQSPSVE